jgi:hypothetical protein
MTIEFPHLLPRRDAEADLLIQEEILVDTHDDEKLAAWYTYLEAALPFPFSAMVLTEEKANTTMYSMVRLEKLAPLERCANRQIWVQGRLSTNDKTLLHFFLADLQSVNKLEAYQPVYHWKYWLNRK